MIPTTRLIPGACAVVALASACGESEALASQAGNAQEVEERSIQVTVWSDRHELFIEYPVPVAGEPIVFVTHVTDHLTTRPRTAGGITFRFTSPGGEALEHPAPEVARDGIYLPEIPFPTAGVWFWEIEVPAPGGPDRIALPAIEVFATHEEADAAELPEAPEGISFLKEQQWRLRTRIERVGVRSVTEHVAVPATVRAAPERRALVTPPVAGSLVAVPGGLPLRIGREVAAGELLAYLRPPFSDFGVRLLEARAEVERTRLALELAQSTRDRVAALFEGRARSQRELEEAEFGLGSARTAHEAAVAVAGILGRSGLILLDEDAVDGPALPLFELRAPIAGRVNHVNAVLGEHVTEERHVVEILDTSRVHVEARVRADDLVRVSSLEAPGFRMLRTPTGAPTSLDVAGARLLSKGLEVDPATQRVPLLYDVANDSGHLLIEMALEVLLPVGSPESSVAVPRTALVDEAGELVVFVELGGEAFEKRYVRLGASDGTWVQVLDGLAEGEWVVTEGAYAVRLASASGGAPSHGHGH
ncbi:MAG: HlyD family efflux transporter periplasmic adaptor subunit [Planctomycetota bacterium]|nr:HlyD family efflux transporter periplasmic adaptor subunit [Planctomycetota bacterium]